MVLQTRKIDFTQDFLKLDNSEKAIAQFEKLHRKETNNSEFKPLTLDEFLCRFENSTDSKNRKVRC